MQFDRDSSGKLNPLPKPSIDTGAGLERLAAVIQGVVSNYETDLFTGLIGRAADLTEVSLDKELRAEAGARSAASLRVIADHARATTFLISDGVQPANEGRGYVLRKIIRRAIRHGRLLGQSKPFLHEMVLAVRDQMKGAYPELAESAGRVAKTVLAEEKRFANTLELGLAKLEEQIAEAKSKDQAYGGDAAFKLYDTFGLPLDFMLDAARDAGIGFDQQGFDAAMSEQRERARASWKGGAKQSASPVFRELAKTTFEGYRSLSSSDCEVLAIVRDGQGVNELKAGDQGEIVLDHTSFYADSGGQVGDTGWLRSLDGNQVVAEVTGCMMPVQGVRAHRVTAKQTIALGDKVQAVVNAEVREHTVRNHTATHLLHAALRETLGKHVKQAGSLVAPGHLRFDFSHFTGVADEELQDIEDLANKEVLRNRNVQVIEDVPIDVAINEYKAMALFGEKYGERVRVIKIGDFSTELCGGTHTAATGEIGLIKVLKEGSVSSGVRRIEAVTGEGSLRHFRKDHELETVVGALIGRSEDGASSAKALQTALESKEEEIRRLRKELEQSRMKSAASAVSSATDKVQDANGIKVLAQRVDNVDRNQMRTLVDNLRNKLGSGVVVLGSSSEDGKVALIAGVTKDLVGKIHAGKIVGEIAKKVGGKGGGRPDLAEAGGTDASQLDSALSGAAETVKALAG
jgi:alanyl-tRNA synthetase